MFKKLQKITVESFVGCAQALMNDRGEIEIALIDDESGLALKLVFRGHSGGFRKFQRDNPSLEIIWRNGETSAEIEMNRRWLS